jgi:hypothetical protein
MRVPHSCRARCDKGGRRECWASRSFVEFREAGPPLLTTLVGCKATPMTNTVVAQAQSPDRKSSALLVDRHYDVARVPDEFFLIVIPGSQSADEAMAAKHIGDSAARVATWASKVQPALAGQ